MEEQEGASLSNERLEILQLLENQLITVDEASRLLEALDRSDRSAQVTSPIQFPNFNALSGFPGVPQPARRQARTVRIRISDKDSGEAKINLALPYKLLDSGLKMAKRFAPDSLLEAQDIKESVEEGFIGHLLDIIEGEDRIEILVDQQEGSGSTGINREIDRERRRAEAEIERQVMRAEREAEREVMKAERQRIKEETRAERDRIKEELRAEREAMKAEREAMKEERRAMKEEARAMKDEWRAEA